MTSWPTAERQVWIAYPAYVAVHRPSCHALAIKTLHS